MCFWSWDNCCVISVAFEKWLSLSVLYGLRLCSRTWKFSSLALIFFFSFFALFLFRMICQSLVSLVKRHAQPLEFQSPKKSIPFLICYYTFRYPEELEFCVGSFNVSHSFVFKVLRIIVKFLGFLISMTIIKFCSGRNSFRYIEKVFHICSIKFDMLLLCTLLKLPSQAYCHTKVKF